MSPPPWPCDEQSSLQRTYAWNRLFPWKAIHDRLLDFLSYVDLDIALGHDPQQVIKVFRGAFRKGAAIEQDKEINLGQRKVPGRDYELKGEKGVYIREQIFLDGKRLYILFVGSESKDYLRSPDANRFFDSLKIDG